MKSKTSPLNALRELTGSKRMLLQNSFSGGKGRGKKRLLDDFSVEPIEKETKRQKFQIQHLTNEETPAKALGCIP